MTAPETIQTDQGEAIKLSYVANPSADGESCMFCLATLAFSTSQTGALWQPYQIMANDTWADIGIEATDGIVLYEISNDRIVFPGDFLTVWETETY